MNDTTKALGSRIRHLRRVKDMTQEQLAEKAVLSIQHIGETERGTGNPTLTSLEKIAAGLGVSLAELFDLDHERFEAGRLREILTGMVAEASEDELKVFYRVMTAIGR